jgi:hypothetical protein
LLSCSKAEKNSFEGANDSSCTQDFDELEKLRSDLAVVVDKIRLCRELLVESPGIETDEVLSEVVGFLEACRDRMAELIEAGTHGMLGMQHAK